MNRLAVSAAIALSALLVACEDNGVVAPGDIEVVAQTTGYSLDPDGYAFVLDGLEQYPIGINDKVLVEEVAPGQHTVELGGLARNCQVVNDNPQDLEIWGDVRSLFFDVRCEAAGSLSLTANTTGGTIDANGYAVAVDGELMLAIRANETAVIRGLLAGPHDVELQSVADNCAVAGDNPRSVDVVADETSVTTFDVTCEPALIDQIAYSRDESGNQEIYLVDRTGTVHVNLTNDPAADRTPAVSPDGTQIAFASDRDGDSEIYVMSYDGLNLVNLTGNAAVDEEPAWSPDGQKIAFVSERDGNPDIYVMNRDGSGVTRLTTHDRADRWPSWSPDGSQIAFTSWRDGNWEIYVMDSDGANKVNITKNLANDRSPDWAPSGELIAFSTDRDGNSEIYAMTPSGTDLENLTNDLGIDLAPSWSPDGTKLAFSTDRGGDLDIYVLNYFVPGLVKLTGSGGSDHHPSWSPMR